ncbi:hypothetical protein HMPREF0381_1044 [Lachnoanaerobaculum saburreum DSM 3986]|uniref:Uncharacterized protein n=1 Tax=Lachnoanaerobaculum saburreum DSM 3986 TaxID=887325 RepID=E6LM59_9FIRM|nr:hypothetical protein HMPREF0381_1044 [Lachnoanaerobaculum saburreum DSM 3986]
MLTVFCIYGIFIVLNNNLEDKFYRLLYRLRKENGIAGTV